VTGRKNPKTKGNGAAKVQAVLRTKTRVRTPKYGHMDANVVGNTHPDGGRWSRPKVRMVWLKNWEVPQEHTVAYRKF